MAQAPRKLFAAERRLRGVATAATTAGVAADPSGVGNDELLEAIQELKGLLQAGAAAAEPGDSGHSLSPQGEREVRDEIADMVRSIARTKKEIAALKHPAADDDRMVQATSELDAVSTATETATNEILAGSEAIEGLVDKMVDLHRGDDDMSLLQDQVQAEITRIMEACNFQDITGQRIGKVIRTLRYIEDRILEVIDIWGKEAFLELSPDETTEEERLMNGPQLEGKGISQDEIDALFD